MINRDVHNFLIIGSINTLFYYTLYSLFIYMEIDYKLSVLLATTFGVLFSFYTMSKYVFKNPKKILIFKFIFNYILLYFLNIYIISLSYKYLVKDLYISGFVAVVVVAIVSYFTNKYFIFKKSVNE